MTSLQAPYGVALVLTHPSCKILSMEATTALDLLSQLRGDRSKRPAIDRGLAGGLRAWLEDELVGFEFREPGNPLRLSPRSITTEGLRSVPGPGVLARAGLVRALLAQRVLTGEVTHAMDEALAALEAEEDTVAEHIHNLEPDAFAQLAAEVTAHDAVLARSLQRVPGSWFPRCNQRLSISLKGGAILLSAQPSLALGPPAHEVATVCLLEVTTSVSDETTARRLGVLALLETLRSQAAPLRVASLSTATGEQTLVEVTDKLLVDAVADVIIAVMRSKR